MSRLARSQTHEVEATTREDEQRLEGKETRGGKPGGEDRKAGGTRAPRKSGGGKGAKAQPDKGKGRQGGEAGQNESQRGKGSKGREARGEKPTREPGRNRHPGNKGTSHRTRGTRGQGQEKARTEPSGRKGKAETEGPGFESLRWRNFAQVGITGARARPGGGIRGGNFSPVPRGKGREAHTPGRAEEASDNTGERGSRGHWPDGDAGRKPCIVQQLFSQKLNYSNGNDSFDHGVVGVSGGLGTCEANREARGTPREATGTNPDPKQVDSNGALDGSS